MNTTAFSITQRAELKRLAAKGNEQFYKVYREIYAGGKYSGLSSDKAFEQLVRYAPLGKSVPRVNDALRTTPQLVSLEPKMRTFRHESFRAAYAYLWEDAQDDKWNFFREQASNLGELMDYTMELLGHEPFNRYNDSTYTSGWDNLTLGNANHLTLSGDTYSNLIAAAAPSETLFETILNKFDEILDDHGRVVPVTGMKMVVHKNRFRAWDQLFKTPTAVTVVTGTTAPASGTQANSAIPSRYTADYNVTTLIGTPYLNQSSQIVALGTGHELVWIDRFGPNQSMYDRDDPPATYHRIWYKGSRGWMDARRIVIVEPS